MRNYRAYVEKGLIKKIDDPFEYVVAQSILGSERFLEQVKRRYPLHREVDEREQPTLAYLQRSFSASDIVAIVAEEFEVTEQQILSRQSSETVARRIAMYCVCHYCRSAESLTNLATFFSVSVSGLTRCRDRALRHIQANRNMRQLMRIIKDKIESANPTEYLRLDMLTYES